MEEETTAVAHEISSWAIISIFVFVYALGIVSGILLTRWF